MTPSVHRNPIVWLGVISAALLTVSVPEPAAPRTARTSGGRPVLTERDVKVPRRARGPVRAVAVKMVRLKAVQNRPQTRKACAVADARECPRDHTPAPAVMTSLTDRQGLAQRPPPPLRC
jgi:hypothetical protein